MRALALASPGRMSLSDLLDKGRSLIHYNTSLILITADSQGGWLDGLFLLMERGNVATVFLIDAETYLEPVDFQQEDQMAAEKQTHSSTGSISPSVQRL